MLCITRKVDDRIVIRLPDGRLCEIAVLTVDRGAVRLGFEFPRDVNIARKEIWREQEASNGGKAPPPGARRDGAARSTDTDGTGPAVATPTGNFPKGTQ